MRRILALLATAALLLLLVPAADADDSASRCVRRQVGFEAWEEWCVDPTNADCPVYHGYHALGDDWHTCYP